MAYDGFIKGKKQLSVKDKMLKVFDKLEQGSEEDIEQLKPSERMRLMTDLAKILMPKSDVDALDEKNGVAANKEGLDNYFMRKVGN